MELSCKVRMYPPAIVQRWSWGDNGDHMEVDGAADDDGDMMLDGRLSADVLKVRA